MSLSELTVDVAVVGAGMAGSACARRLAEAGRSVTLIGPPPHLDLVHLSPVSIDILDELGVNVRSVSGSWPISTSSVKIGPAAPRPIWPERPGHTARRDMLIGRLQALLSPDASRWFGHAAGLTADETGVTLAVDSPDGRSRRLRAKYVVIATGDDPGKLGVPLGSREPGALCSTRLVSFEGEEHRAGFRAYVPLGGNLAASSTSGWVNVLPGGRQAIAGILIPLGSDDLRRDISTHFDELRDRAATDEIILRDTESLHEAPLRHDFSPDRCGQERVLIAGESAGLSNPFTGEGICHSLESGLHAARSIDEHFTSPGTVAKKYRLDLSTSFLGELDTARWGRRRSRIGWHVLVDTAAIETPFIAKIRRAALSPSGLAATTSVPSDSVAPAPGDAAFYATCDSLLLGAIRDDWPFLARTARHSILASRIRLTRLVLESARVTTAESRRDLPRLAAATELALLASLAGLSVERSTEDAGFSWGQASTVIASDFLLAQSFRFAARIDAPTAEAFADWLQELVRVRSEEVIRGVPKAKENFLACAYSFPARMAAHLSGADDGLVQQLGSLGSLLGSILLCAENLAAAAGGSTRLECGPKELEILALSRLPAWCPKSNAETSSNLAQQWAELPEGTRLSGGFAELDEFLNEAAKVIDDIDHRNPGRSSALHDMLDHMAKPATQLPEYLIFQAQK